MNRRIKFLIGVLAVVSLGIGFGYLLSRPIPTPDSGGQQPVSPDGRFWAVANTYSESALLGNDKHTYSKFVIQTPPPDSQVIRSVRIEDSAQSLPQTSIDWREDGRVQWASNSSAVTFSYDGPRTSFRMTLKIQP
jgi:hypothetical protein